MGIVKRRGIGAALVAGLVLNGCWLQLGNGPGHTRFTADSGGLDRTNVATLHELWSADVGVVSSEPMVLGGNVFVAVERGPVSAYDRATGDQRWSVGPVDVLVPLKAHGAELVGEPDEYEDSYRLCYVRGLDGIIVALAEQIS